MSETKLQPLLTKSSRKQNTSRKLTEQEKQEKIILEKKLLGKGASLVSSELSADIKEEKDDLVEDKSFKRPIWVDEDDSKIPIPCKLRKYKTIQKKDTYEELLRRKYQQTVGSPKWASKKIKKDEFEDESNELMRCGNVLKSQYSLAKGVIKVDKMKDLNTETKVEGPLINAVEFHPTSTAALVAGQAGIVSIFQVDGINNCKLQSIKFRGFAIDCAHFTTDGEQFVIGNRKARSFWYYDMMEGKSVQVPIHTALSPLNMSKFKMSPDGKIIAVCGKFGNIHLLTAKTKEWVGNLKMNSEVNDLSFNRDGSKMYSFSDDGEIYEWQMNTRQCSNKFQDDGCFKGISLALSPNEQILATGSSSGIVNLYEMPAKVEPMYPKKIIKNLVTPITCMSFNSTSEILAIGSAEKHNAIRLVHFPSMTIFSNYPGFHEVGTPRVVSFSPLSGFFAVGNGQRNVLLYRLKDFRNY